jgi:hypothetical protein
VEDFVRLTLTDDDRLIPVPPVTENEDAMDYGNGASDEDEALETE